MPKTSKPQYCRTPSNWLGDTDPRPAKADAAFDEIAGNRPCLYAGRLLDQALQPFCRQIGVPMISDRRNDETHRAPGVTGHGGILKGGDGLQFLKCVQAVADSFAPGSLFRGNPQQAPGLFEVAPLFVNPRNIPQKVRP
jgi:hypothetical protein